MAQKYYINDLLKMIEPTHRAYRSVRVRLEKKLWETPTREFEDKLIEVDGIMKGIKKAEAILHKKEAAENVFDFINKDQL